MTIRSGGSLTAKQMAAGRICCGSLLEVELLPDAERFRFDVSYCAHLLTGAVAFLPGNEIRTRPNFRDAVI